MLAAHGRTFHFAARFLPPNLRSPVVTLYAFFRTLDDLVDEPTSGSSPAAIRDELAAWRSWLASGHAGPAPREPLGASVAALIAAYGIPPSIFLDFLDGMTSDLEPREVLDFAELRRYCYCVAGTVGLAMTYVLGAASPQALAAAESLGIAMQLTNVLRDVGTDLTAGRIYLPRDELTRFGSSRAHLERLAASPRGPDERFRALMRAQIARAHSYYAFGMAGIWLLPRDCRMPILIAARLYRAILTAIERGDYNVLHQRAATSFPEKVREAAVAFTIDRLWRRGEVAHAHAPEVPLDR